MFLDRKKHQLRCDYGIMHHVSDCDGQSTWALWYALLHTAFTCSLRLWCCCGAGGPTLNEKVREEPAVHMQHMSLGPAQ